MDRGHLTLPDVLRAFDRAIGLDAAPRPSSPDAGIPTRSAAPSIEPRLPRTSGDVRTYSETVSLAAGSAGANSESEGATMRPGEWTLPAHWLTDAGTREQRAARLDEIRAAHDQACPHCTTATSHQRTVFGEGNPAAELMFIGEAPGETEDSVGRPFVGRAGQKLDEMIRAMGLQREDVYIANVLKSRPPDNRTPLQHEVDACGPFLVAQILAVRPRVIVTLGGPAAKLVLGEVQGITRLRGVWRQWMAPSGAGLDPVAVMPTYHPAYLLRNYTVKIRSEVWSDLKAVLKALGRPYSGGDAGGSVDNS